MAAYKRLFIWVEGSDDKRFFEKIIEPKFQIVYNFIEMIEYSTLKKEKIDNFLKSIKAMGADYLFISDINNSPCVTIRKQKIQNQLKNIESDKIIIVIKEIEGWYLAGLPDSEAAKLNMKPYRDTDSITKEQFNHLKPDMFDSRIDFMLEILKIYSIQNAKKKNISFKYFIDKFIKAKT